MGGTSTFECTLDSLFFLQPLLRYTYRPLFYRIYFRWSFRFRDSVFIQTILCLNLSFGHIDLLQLVLPTGLQDYTVAPSREGKVKIGDGLKYTEKGVSPKERQRRSNRGRRGPNTPRVSI